MNSTDTHRIGGTRTVRIGASDELRVSADQMVTVGGSRKEQVKGPDELLVRGDRTSVIYGVDTRIVWAHARTILSGGATLTVSNGLSVAVGSRSEPASAEGNISGDLALRGDGSIELSAGKSIRIRVGKTLISIDPEEVSIEAEKITLSGKSIVGKSVDTTLSLGEKAELSGKSLRFASKDNAILELDTEARIDGEAVKIKPGLAAEMAKRDERDEQAPALEKVKVHLFDRKGQSITNAPYEVSFFGYLDEGTSPDGAIEIPKFPDIDKAHVRWGRPMVSRERPNKDEPYEFAMDVFLVLDAPDAAPEEAMRRKLHNLGFHGRELHEAVHKYQAASGMERSGRMDDIREDAESRHGDIKPIERIPGD